MAHLYEGSAVPALRVFDRHLDERPARNPSLQQGANLFLVSFLVGVEFEHLGDRLSHPIAGLLVFAPRPAGGDSPLRVTKVCGGYVIERIWEAPWCWNPDVVAIAECNRDKFEPLGLVHRRRQVGCNNLTFRARDQLRTALESAAAASGRSVSEEIEFRLNRDFSWEAGKLRIEEMVAETKAQLDASRIQAIRQAGFQIVREVGGNVTVNVSPELLLAEADGILRHGFVAEENIDKSPTQIMIERVIKREFETVKREFEGTLRDAGLLGRKGAA